MGNNNAATLRRLYDAFGRGDVESVMAAFPDDVSFHIGGASPVAGDYVGKGEVLGYLGTLMERSGGTFRLEVLDILASDERATVLTRETAHRDGRSLDNRAVHA